MATTASGKTLPPADYQALEAAYTVAATHILASDVSAWTFESFQRLMGEIGEVLKHSDMSNC